MQRLLLIAIVVSTTLIVAAQQPSSDGPLWEPVILELGANLPPPTLKREVIQTVRIGRITVRLDRTPFRAIERRFGLKRGQSGDASESLQWVCLSGSDPNGDWILWLEGVEVNGDNIGGFALHRLEPGRAVDDRCRRTTEKVIIPNGLWLGMSSEAIREILGAPRLTRGTVSGWLFERESKDRFITDLSIDVIIENDAVTTIRVLKTEVN